MRGPAPGSPPAPAPAPAPAAARAAPARYAAPTPAKAAGATYTPPALAAFVAARVAAEAALPARGDLHALDPAVGDGALLAALVDALPAAARARLVLTGVDTDAAALDRARERLSALVPPQRLRLVHGDFLRATDDACAGPFHLVAANPPYVRTQVLGAEAARALARSFGLAGRVDLCHAFLLALAARLAPGGTAGLIVSNRFMTTRAGATVRGALRERLALRHVWDLGDTRLFDAAVLPAVLLARGRDPAADARTLAGAPAPSTGFSSLYATSDPADRAAGSPLDALAAPDGAVAALPDGRRLRVRHGTLDAGGAGSAATASPTDAPGRAAVWRLSTGDADAWLAAVAARTWGTFGRIGRIRVGVKSTADRVFVRRDWDAQPDGRPELLRPLMGRQAARRWRAHETAGAGTGDAPLEILYPHERAPGGGRRAVDLAAHPRARAYLERHRDALASRRYLAAAGRAWYELWVPQDPGAWTAPKLVFPDISARPVAWMDLDGRVVNGECYWLRADDPADEPLLWLALAVANSRFVERFYDHRFHNRLYAGRRRFITQYVEQFPLPDPATPAARALAEGARRLHALAGAGAGVPAAAEADALDAELDRQVWAAFGVSSPA